MRSPHILLGDHRVKPEDLEIVGELPEARSQNVLTIFGQQLEAQISCAEFCIWPDQSQSGTEHPICDSHVSQVTLVTLPTLGSIVTL